MNGTKTNHWKLGLFVVTAVGITAGAAYQLGLRRFHREVETVVTYFDESVQGLDQGSPVKARGVTIGYVQLITVAPDQKHVEVHADLYIDVLDRLGLHSAETGIHAERQDEVRLQLTSAGITGLRFLEFDFYDAELYPPQDLPFETPENYVPAIRSTLKNLEQGLRDSAIALPNTLVSIEKLADTMRTKLEQLDVEAVNERAIGLLDLVEAKLAAVDTQGISDELKLTITDIRETSTSMRVLIDKLGTESSLFEVLDQWNSTGAALEKALVEARFGEMSQSLINTAEAYRPVAWEVSRVAGQLESNLTVLQEALESMRALASLLERDPGALLRGRQ